MPKYKVKSGSVTLIRGGKRNRHDVGDTFEAPEKEVRNKMDVLEQVSGGNKEKGKAKPDPAPEPEPEQGGLFVKHQGFGKYGIYDQDADDWFDKLGVSKEEADAKLAEIQ